MARILNFREASLSQAKVGGYEGQEVWLRLGELRLRWGGCVATATNSSDFMEEQELWLSTLGQVEVRGLRRATNSSDPLQGQD